MVHTLIIFEPIWPMLQNLSNAQMYMYTCMYSKPIFHLFIVMYMYMEMYPIDPSSLLSEPTPNFTFPISYPQSLLLICLFILSLTYYSCTSCSCILFTFFLLFQSNFPPPIILPIPDLYYLVHVHVFIHPLYILSTIPIQSSTPNHPSYT